MGLRRCIRTSLGYVCDKRCGVLLFFLIRDIWLVVVWNLLSHDMTSLRWLQQFPAALDILLAEPRYYALRNFVKVTRGQRQNRRTRSG